MPLTSLKPHLANGYVAWCWENNIRPYVAINCANSAVQVPPHIEKKVIPFNLSMEAVVGLTIDAEGVSFSGRFGGAAFLVKAPWSAIKGFYTPDLTEANAQLNLGFIESYLESDGNLSPPPPEPPKKERPSFLKVVEK